MLSLLLCYKWLCNISLFLEVISDEMANNKSVLNVILTAYLWCFIIGIISSSLQLNVSVIILETIEFDTFSLGFCSNILSNRRDVQLTTCTWHLVFAILLLQLSPSLFLFTFYHVQNVFIDHLYGEYFWVFNKPVPYLINSYNDVKQCKNG